MSGFDDMVEFLDSAYCMKDQIVPCLVGPIGIGKTAAVEQHAKNVGAKRVVKIVASQILPNEVSGITMPDKDTKSMEIFDHYRLSSMEDGDILFFDELLEADQMVLSACLTLLEGRELMSGRKLPDIQIIAATNPTIQPNMLKESIRNRFVFRRFGIDNLGCKLYIKEKIGIDVGVLVNDLKETGNEYNILSQRSLTKMAEWIMRVPEDKVDDTAAIINSVWKDQTGTILAKARRNAEKMTPEEQAKTALKSTVIKVIDRNHERPGAYFVSKLGDNVEMLTEDEKLKDSTFEELMEIVQQLPEWNEIAEELSKMEIDEGEDLDSYDNISF